MPERLGSIGLFYKCVDISAIIALDASKFLLASAWLYRGEAAALFPKPPQEKIKRVKGLLYDGFSFAVARQIKISNYNSLMVSVTEILLILLAGAYAATTAARITNRIMTIKEVTGKLHVA